MITISNVKKEKPINDKEVKITNGNLCITLNINVNVNNYSINFK
jgi:hypothetical protein